MCEFTLEKKIDYNRKRALRISRQSHQNARVRENLIDYMISHDLNDEELRFFSQFRRSIDQCGHRAAFREHHCNRAIEYMACQTCKHKYCAICNSERARLVRRKYRQFFVTYPEILEQYDFMHLTLTLPHDQNGYQGEKIYIDRLIREFNFMRKKAWWKEMVYAGEYGIEVTKNDSGLHIHLHSMLLVHKSDEYLTRNTLQRKILEAWNKQTATGERKKFGLKQLVGLRKSLSFLNHIKSDASGVCAKRKAEFRKVLAKLNPSGATLIGLESIYRVSKTGKKIYVNIDQGMDFFMKGVMECIKYHFEPLAMKKDSGEPDFDLMREILPAIYAKRLYGKFGAFHGGTKNSHEGAKMLSLSAKSERDEAEKELEDLANEEVYNPETKEKAEKGDYTYFLAPAGSMFIDASKNHKILVNPRKKKYYPDVGGLRNLLLVMIDLMINDRMRAEMEWLERIPPDYHMAA